MFTVRRLIPSALLLATLPLTACSAGPSASPTPAQHLANTATPSATASPSTTPTPSPSATPSPAQPRVDCAVNKCLALTFDDGPGPYTDQILDALVKHKATATFFVLGEQVKAFPKQLQREHQLGMAIGDHSWSHRDLSRASREKATEELTSTADVIKQVTGTAPTMVRPPYGAFRKSTPHAGMPFVLWDVDTLDWKNRSASRTTELALAGAHRGAIILMHDIHPSTARAVPGMIAALQAKGYTLVTVPELLGPMSPGGVYFTATPPSTRPARPSTRPTPPSTRPTPMARRA
ncbi:MULTISPECIES: polysaccharide deacetylase family protein [unclassified Luteococcus]|uniref:polysaccharide deacetylase family protein n=1 Tax=unclassified Luteococcus TaxID=2639923 RepID=UPI00313C687C